MATRTTRRASSSTGRPRGGRKPARAPWTDSFRVPPHVVRSLIGLTLLVVGAVTFVALLFPEAGVFARYVSEILRPAVGQGAWLLAALLIVAGVLVERPSGVGYGSSLAIVGGLIVFAAGLGLIHLVWGTGSSHAALSAGGGVLGNGLSALLSDLLSPIGAFIVLLGLLGAGLILLLNVTLRGLLSPVTGGGRILASAIATPARAIAEGAANRRAAQALQPTGPGRPAGGKSERTADRLAKPDPASTLPSPKPPRPRSAKRSGARSQRSRGRARTLRP